MGAAKPEQMSSIKDFFLNPPHYGITILIGASIIALAIVVYIILKGPVRNRNKKEKQNTSNLHQPDSPTLPKRQDKSSVPYTKTEQPELFQEKESDAPAEQTDLTNKSELVQVYPKPSPDADTDPVTTIPISEVKASPPIANQTHEPDKNKNNPPIQDQPPPYALEEDKQEIPQSAEDTTSYTQSSFSSSLRENLPALKVGASRRTATKSKISTPVNKTTKQSKAETEKNILSQPNQNQTDDLRINYTPSNLLLQPDLYTYPVVKMPEPNSFLKLPRLGRSESRGYKENDFFTLLQKEITYLTVVSNFHLAIPYSLKPYEPDIVIFNESLNLYLDIEIDEPYDGYYRKPTHTIESNDTIRDLFFTQSGWIVIRFTEKQVHEQSTECLLFIKKVLSTINQCEATENLTITSEPQWDNNQAIRWASENYRENYLGIPSFSKRMSKTRIVVQDNDTITDPIETKIIRPAIYNPVVIDSNTAFDEDKHAYFPISNPTGNADYTSVTTLIERFFPFDIEKYISIKMKETGKTREEIQAKLTATQEIASSKGTYLHKQIENFLKGLDHDDKLTEFIYFKNFYDTEIKPGGLSFVKAEKIITADDYGIAGTVDALFKKPNLTEHIVLDWKRSKKLAIDGRPKKYGFGFAISELSHLDNSSWFKYTLQQNLYKFILEKYYGYHISSMWLVVLHENHDKYYRFKVDDMSKEVKIILKSISHKI